MIDPEELNARRRRIEEISRKFFGRLFKRPPRDIDSQIREMDEEVFSGIDCTRCANCCKTISPVFKNRDIIRLAEHFRVRPSIFTEKYLMMDEEGDYVLKSTPCPFLNSDNLCTVYQVRPQACSSYPHTGTLPASKSVNLLIKNSAVCPAVYEITEKLKKIYHQNAR